MKAANARAAAGGDVIHMEIGQPSTGAPAAALAAATQAMGQGPLGYTDALGLPALREAISLHYRRTLGIDVPARRIIVTTGSSGAFLLAFIAAFAAGDRVALAEPGYPAYRNILASLDVVPVGIPVGPAERFQPTLAQLGALTDIAGVLVASPANPTGTMIEAVALRALAADCAARGRWLIVDEIYHGITYGGPAASVLSFTDQAIVINSFSKYFSMTGWRLGWMVVPDDLLRTIERLAQNLFIAPPAISQVAGIAALDSADELDANVARYSANRQLLLNELPAAGFDSFAPADGAFYLYADVARLTDDAPAFCVRMLAETGVATTPGIDFDPLRGKSFLRFSFAGATADMAEAARRLNSWRK